MPVTLPRLSLRGGAALLLALGIVAGPALAASGASTSPVARTAVAAAGTPVSFTLLVPLTVRPTATGLIDATTLATYTAPLGMLTRQLDAVIGTPAVIGVDPMIIASIRVLGTDAPASALDWLARLQGLNNEVFALAYSDADLASLARVDALNLRDPIGFDTVIDPSHFGPAATASPTPTAAATGTPSPSPSPTAGNGSAKPALPTSTDEVLDWAYTLQHIAWPADDTLVSGDLSDLGAAGYKQVVLTSTNLSATDSGLVDLGSVQGVVADAGVTSLVREAVSSSDPATLQDALGRLNSALGGMEAVSPGRTIVATLDRHWPLGSLNLSGLFADLGGQASVRTVGLSAVLAGAHPDARLTDEPGDAARTASLRSILAATAQEDSFATVADTPTAITEPRRLQLLSLLAVSWLRGTDDWATQANGYLTASVKLRSSVQIVGGSDLFVGAGSTNIPVTVSNALSVPVTVLVNVSSPSSVLQVQKQNVALKIEPGSSNKAAIPVQALTNGTVTTSVTITSASGVPIGTPDSVRVDLQPGWESVGTTVIIVLLVLIFGGGIARNVVKRRAARRADAPVERSAEAEADRD